MVNKLRSYELDNIIDEIMTQVEVYAQAAIARSRGAQVPHNERVLARQKLELMLQNHFGGTEPFATVSISGAYVSTKLLQAVPEGAVSIPLYAAPQVAVPADADRVRALEEFYKVAMEQADLIVERDKEAARIKATMRAVMQRLA